MASWVRTRWKLPKKPVVCGLVPGPAATATISICFSRPGVVPNRLLENTELYAFYFRHRHAKTRLNKRFPIRSEAQATVAKERLHSLYVIDALSDIFLDIT
jgi:hypothetical protein